MDERVIKIVNEARWADGQRVRKRLEDITYDPMRSQKEFVMRMMRENSRTAYGQAHGFDTIRHLDDFQHLIPVTTYDDYLPYIERIANGEKNVLTAFLTEHFTTQQGYRMLPQSRWSVQTSYDYCFCSSFYIAGRHGYLTDGLTLNLVENSLELLRTYCGSQVHFIFTGISSSEGTFTTPLNLDDPQTVLLPNSIFYEFKPVEAKGYTTLLTLDQLEIGRSYELIVTTLSGLYRYKTRKTLLVVGRYHDTPTVIINNNQP